MTAPIRYEIEHVSRYTYASPMRNCVMSLCLRPQDDEGQHVARFELTTQPHGPHNAEADGFGNTKHVLNIHREHEGLVITARSIVDSLPRPTPPDALDIAAWDEVRAWAGSLADWNFMHPTALTRPSASLDAYMARTGLAEPDGDPLTALLGLMETIHDSFSYQPGTTSTYSPIDHALETGTGVCQDYAHVMLAVARGWGVPSRYVSGYVEARGTVEAQPTTGATHAWVECKLPGLGWTGFDPTNRCLADQRHIRIGVGRDYQDVAPTRGVLLGNGETRLDVSVRMRRAE